MYSWRLLPIWLLLRRRKRTPRAGNPSDKKIVHEYLCSCHQCESNKTRSESNSAELTTTTQTNKSRHVKTSRTNGGSNLELAKEQESAKNAWTICALLRARLEALVLPSIRDHQCSFESFASALCCFGPPQGCSTPMPAQTIGCVYLERFCLVWRILLGVSISCFVQTHSLPVRLSLRNWNSVFKMAYLGFSLGFKILKCVSPISRSTVCLTQGFYNFNTLWFRCFRIKHQSRTDNFNTWS